MPIATPPRAHFRALTLAALVLAFGAPSANATDFCNGNGTILRVGVGDADAAYVAIDNLLGPTVLLAVIVYAESNGIRDLQRGGATLLGDEDVCQDHPAPDLAIL